MQFDLPASLRDQQVMVGWCTLFLTVVGKEPPESSLPEDLDEREVNHWWKAKKWSYANLNRLYVRWVAQCHVLHAGNTDKEPDMATPLPWARTTRSTTPR